MTLAQELTKEHIEQLRQLSKGPAWDNNLISKSARDWLFNHNLIHRIDGWNFLAADGVRLSSTFGLIRK